MSGGGGGSGGGGPIGFGGGTGGPSDDGTECEKLRFNTMLASPDPAVVALLAVNDVLDLEIRNQAVAALARSAGGSPAGYIIDRLPQLLRCLQAGTAFEADVKSISGGAVTVEVHAA